MAREIRLESGPVISRVWDGEGFQFGFSMGEKSDDAVIFAPTVKEMLALGALFRQAGLKMRRKGVGAKEYEAPTLKPLCSKPPAGWYCTREPGHEGPCAARPLP